MNRLALIPLVKLVLLAATPFAPSPAAAASGLADYRALYAESSSWPFYTSLVEAREIGGRTVDAGTRGVLIRMPDAATVIVDFGRDGLATLPAGATDILERARRVAAGTEEKDFPNYIMQVGPRLVIRRGDKLGNYDFKKLPAHGYFLTVYVGEDEATLAAVAKALGNAAGEIGRRNVFVMLMPMQVASDHAFAGKLASAGITAPFMYSHLAGFYANSLRHDTRNLPLVVLNDADGKVLGTVNGAADNFAGNILELIQQVPAPVPAAPGN